MLRDNNNYDFSNGGDSNIASVLEDVMVESPYSQDDPARAVDDLICAMSPHRRMLMSIMQWCSSGSVKASELYDEIEQMQEYYPSVFTPSDFCCLLADAGAIGRVHQDGSAYADVGSEPDIVEENGIRYYQPASAEDMYWSLLEPGQTILDDDDPLARARSLLAQEEELAEIFSRVLEMCDGQGCTIDELNEAINDDPLVQEPRVYAPYFVDRLEKCDAIEWQGAWKLTDVGSEILAELSDKQ